MLLFKYQLYHVIHIGAVKCFLFSEVSSKSVSCPRLVQGLVPLKSSTLLCLRSSSGPIWAYGGVKRSHYPTLKVPKFRGRSHQKPHDILSWYLQLIIIVCCKFLHLKCKSCPYVSSIPSVFHFHSVLLVILLHHIDGLPCLVWNTNKSFSLVKTYLIYFSRQ